MKSASSTETNQSQEKGFWFVMDGRARTNPERAVILEAMHAGVRGNVPIKAARKGWKDHGATLCFSPLLEDRTYGHPEYVEDV